MQGANFPEKTPMSLTRFQQFIQTISKREMWILSMPALSVGRI
jgi:hypothetical protein